MQMLISPNWKDYELIDSGNGKRLERFGKYLLVRPDPQAIWEQKLSQSVWGKADAVFKRKTEDKGVWMYTKQLQQKWLMHYKDLSFWIKLTPFKHTGVFPEQSVQWDYISSVISNQTHGNQLSNNTTDKQKADRLKLETNTTRPHILNLFGYTGIASLAAASAGAKVTHVDASKPAVTWARENQAASKLSDKPIRWIVDDALKFCQREVKRGVKYDGIIMDPPIYGHGPQGETWKFAEDFPQLLSICKKLLSDTPLFLIVNAYAISASSLMLKNVIEDNVGTMKGVIDYGELALQDTSGRLLSTGIFGKWTQ